MPGFVAGVVASSIMSIMAGLVCSHRSTVLMGAGPMESPLVPIHFNNRNLFDHESF